ncbi:MAG: RidA family protein [Elsteraceae bacterium]
MRSLSFRSFATLLIGVTIGVAGSAAAQVGLRFLNPAGLYDASKYYSHVAIAPPGTTIYIAGQIGVNADRSIVGPDKAAQVRRAFANLRTAIEAAGAQPKDVVKINVYSVNHVDADLAVIGAESQALFGGGPLPASTLVPTPRLAAEGLLFEIDAIAVLPGR